MHFASRHSLVCPPRPRLPSGEPDPQLPRAINALVGPLFLSSDSFHPATKPPPPACAAALPCLLFLSLLRCRTSNTERSVQVRGTVHRAAVLRPPSLSAACGVPAWDPERRYAPSTLSGGSRDFFRRNLLRKKELPRAELPLPPSVLARGGGDLRLLETPTGR